MKRQQPALPQLFEISMCYNNNKKVRCAGGIKGINEASLYSIELFSNCYVGVHISFDVIKRE